MTKSELILKLAEANPHLYQRDIETLVATIFEEITHALENGNRVELRGFGAFSTKQREARTGRNPRTGDSVMVIEKSIPFFKAGNPTFHVAHNLYRLLHGDAPIRNTKD